MSSGQVPPGSRSGRSREATGSSGRHQAEIAEKRSLRAPVVSTSSRPTRARPRTKAPARFGPTGWPTRPGSFAVVGPSTSSNCLKCVSCFRVEARAWDYRPRVTPCHCTSLSQDFQGILCAIPCVAHESWAQRIAGRSREFAKITGFPRGAKDSVSNHAHEADTYDADSYHQVLCPHCPQQHAQVCHGLPFSLLPTVNPYYLGNSWPFLGDVVGIGGIRGQHGRLVRLRACLPQG